MVRRASRPPPPPPLPPDEPTSPGRRPSLSRRGSVGHLRPKRATTIRASWTVSEAAERMALVGAEAAVIIEGGELVGILTDADVTCKARRALSGVPSRAPGTSPRRSSPQVVAAGVAPDAVTVGEAMSRDPRTVGAADTTSGALSIMLAERTRHLPVLGSDGSLAGLLDVHKLLHDAILGRRPSFGPEPPEPDERAEPATLGELLPRWLDNGSRRRRLRCTPDQLVAHAAVMLSERREGALLVELEGKCAHPRTSPPAAPRECARRRAGAWAS